MPRPRRIGEDLNVLAELPLLSPVVAELTATLNTSDVDFRDVEAIIRRDPIIAARVISAANAAAFAGHGATASIHAAVLRLGVLAVRRLALLLSLYEAVPASDANRKPFWRHSLAVAHVAEVIARHVPGEQADHVFIGALLHDVGLLVLGRHFPREEAMVLSVAAERGLARWQVEHEILGIDHAQLGARLAAHWSFPEGITAVIAFHHNFAAAPAQARWLAAVIALADSLCNEDEAATMGEGAHVGTIEAAIAELALAPDAFGKIVDETRTDSARALSMLETVAVG